MVFALFRRPIPAPKKILLTHLLVKTVCLNENQQCRRAISFKVRRRGRACAAERKSYHSLEQPLQPTVWPVIYFHSILCLSYLSFCKRLPSHTVQEQACTRITWLFVCLFGCNPAENGWIHRMIAVDCAQLSQVQSHTSYLSFFYTSKIVGE